MEEVHVQRRPGYDDWGEALKVRAVFTQVSGEGGSLDGSQDEASGGEQEH